MLATVLLACHPAGSPAPGDLLAPCDLVHPWELGSLEDVAVASAASASRVASVLLLDADAHLTAKVIASNGETCPSYSESADGVTVTVSGDCTTEWG